MLNQHKTILDNIAKFNKPNPLVDYLVPFTRGKMGVKIADIASGPFVTIGTYGIGVVVQVYPSDNQDFTNFYKKYNVIPLIPIEYQNMEALSYKDNKFDLVVCQNSLDHTKDALQAVREMIRVCKLGGYIYIDCCLYQMDTGHKHFWNAREDGTFTNGKEMFDLKELGFTIEYKPNELEKRYHHIIATKKK